MSAKWVANPASTRGVHPEETLCREAGTPKSNITMIACEANVAILQDSEDLARFDGAQRHVIRARR